MLELLQSIERRTTYLDRYLPKPAKNRPTRTSLDRYSGAPIDFIRQELRSEITAEQREVCNSVRDFTTTVVKSANSVGKTFVAARLAIWFYKVFPGAQVYTTAAPPESNLKRLLWGEVGDVIARRPELFTDDAVGVLNVAQSPKSFIAGVTIPTSGTEAQREAKFSGKHAPHLFFIVDEGDAVPEEVYRGIEACMSGGHARLLIMFNPRHESGPVYRMERDHQANVISLSAFGHPNVISGEDKIPGAVTRAKTVRRINEWSRPLVEPEKPDHECFQVPDFLVGASVMSDSGIEYPPLPAGWRRVTNPALSYMVLGQYPAQSETQLINRAWINAARARWDAYVVEHGEIPPAGVKPVQGQDCAEFGVDENVSLFRYGGFVARPIAWGGVDTVVTGERAAGYYYQSGAYLANVDATGLGAGVYPVMQRKGCRVNRVMVASSPTRRVEEGEFGMIRDQLFWAVREWLRKDPGAMLPPDEKLVEELAVPTYRTNPRTRKIEVMSKDVMKDLLKRSPDRLDSLALTFYAGASHSVPGDMGVGKGTVWH